MSRQAIVELILAERLRQVVELGYNYDHDDGHKDGEMANAAAWYASDPAYAVEFLWPKSWGPQPQIKFDHASRVRELIKAGALILAELERLERVDYQRKQKEAEKAPADIWERFEKEVIAKIGPMDQPLSAIDLLKIIQKARHQ